MTSGTVRSTVALLRSVPAAVVLSGCAAMLPDASNSARSGFGSFEAAESALAKVVPTGPR
jgi:hypothetical protein